MDASRCAPGACCWLACALVALSGCKEAPAAGNPQALQATDERVGIHDLATDFAEATCAQERRCTASAPAEGACEQALKPRFDTYATRLATSHRRGRLTYDGEKLKRCLATIAHESCTDGARRATDGPPPGSDCDTWIVPHVGLGAKCSDDNECMSGYCQGRAAAIHRTLSDGQCAPLPDVGQPCTDTCVRGATCDTTFDAPHCVPDAGLEPG